MQGLLHQALEALHVDAHGGIPPGCALGKVCRAPHLIVLLVHVAHVPLRASDIQRAPVVAEILTRLYGGDATKGGDATEDEDATAAEQAV